jgi:hypothetical protein
MHQQVYVIVNTETRRIKIGITGNIERRLQTLRMQGGCDLYVYYLSPFVYDAYQIENLVHAALSKYRYIGEWFTLEPDVAVKTIEKYLDYSNCVKKKDKNDLFSESELKRRIKEFLKEINDIQEHSEEHILNEPLTRFKSIGNGYYQRKGTAQIYRIRYRNKQWLIKRMKDINQ